MDELAQVFNRFATFGAGKGKFASETASPPLMDSRSLQKLCRDCHLFSPPLLTSTEVDLIFKKVKPRNELKIDFIEFVECTRQMAEKLGVPHVDLIEKILQSDGPTLNTALSPPISHNSNQINSSHSPDKMTHRSLKSEFDASASSDVSQQSSYNDSRHQATSLHANQGQETQYLSSSSSVSRNNVIMTVENLHPDWYAVRNPHPTCDYDLIYYANRFTNETTWEKPEINRIQPSVSKAHQTPSRRIESYPPSSSASANAYANASTIPKSQEPKYNYQHQSTPSSAIASSRAPQSGSEYSQHRSIFDKLTDTSLYTGSHKYRFDETGRGLGLAGRDSVKKGSGFATAGSTNAPTVYRGNTNTGTNEVFHDISEFVQRR